MKPADLRTLSPDELAARIAQLRRSVFDHMIKHQTRQLENTSSLRTVKRDLARVLTIERERSRQQ